MEVSHLRLHTYGSEACWGLAGLGAKSANGGSLVIWGREMRRSSGSRLDAKTEARNAVAY
jgi:hypothetical protein